MENMNVLNTHQTGIITADLEPLPPITRKTKLGEVIAMLKLGERPSKTPGTKMLRLSSEPIADIKGCTLFRNGFAIYENRSGRTVVWLPYCTSFTYYFNKLRDAEKNTLSETYSLPQGYLEKQPWVIAVTLIGDHRVEANVMNRNGSRVGSTDFDSSDLDDCDDECTEAVAASYQKKFNWMDERVGESPLDIVIRRESHRELMAALTDKQRYAFVLYYEQGYNQCEIAKKLGSSQQNVNNLLSASMKKMKKIYGGRL